MTPFRTLDAGWIWRFATSRIAAEACFGSRHADAVREAAQQAQRNGETILRLELRDDSVVIHSADAGFVTRGR